MAECQVTASTSAVSKLHILLVLKRMVVHYSIIPRATTELGAIVFAVGCSYF
jgi:hypothetical protein